MFLGLAMCTCANVGINLGTNIIKLAFNRRQNKIELEESVPHDASDAVAMNGNGDASPTDPVKKKMTANARSSYAESNQRSAGHGSEGEAKEAQVEREGHLQVAKLASRLHHLQAEQRD